MKKWKMFLMIFVSVVCFGLGYHGFYIDYHKTYLQEAHGTVFGLDQWIIGTEMIVKNSFGIEMNRVRLFIKKEEGTYYISEDYQKTWREVGNEGDKIFIVTLCEKAENYVLTK